jgi:hypothetical protein
MNKQELDALAASVTPQRVQKLLVELETLQPKVNRGTVPLYALLDALTVGVPLHDAAAGSQMDMRLRKAILAALRDLPSLTFHEGDG